MLYLTGGHFENTATYELLRRIRPPATAVRLILMCDCGADPEYQYQDLSNMIRLAQIDFTLEVEVDHGAADPRGTLGHVSGPPRR